MEIFISYKKEDHDKAFLYYHALEKHGYQGWLYEKHCHGGTYHREQVKDAIIGCKAVLFIMSRHSIASDEVTFELHTSQEYQKPVFPIYYDFIWENFLKIKADWKQILELRTGIDASDPDKAIANLISGLQKEGIHGKAILEPDLLEKRDRIVPVIYSGSLDHFINRSKELQAIKDYIDDDYTRLIMLTGPGGYGKSAIVEKLIYDITDKHQLDQQEFHYGIDSIVWFNFGEEETRSVDAVFDMLIKTFPKQKASDLKRGWLGQDSLSSKFNFLFGRLLSKDRRLIIFDNFESLLDSTAISEQYKDMREFINSFLNTDHVSIILMTSRVSLNLGPEIEGKYGKRKKEIIMDYGLPEDEAVELVIDLDTENYCHSRETDKNLIREVVKKLDCVPRTIEYLVGRLKNDEKCIDEFYNDEDFYDLIADPTREFINGLKEKQKRIIEVISVFNRPVTRQAIGSFFPGIEVRSQLISLKKCFALKETDNKQYYLHSIIQKIVYDQIGNDENYSRKLLHKKAANWYATQHLEKDKWLAFDDVQSFINEIQHRILAEEFDKACEVLNLIDREYLSVWNYYNLVIQFRNEMMGKIKDERLNELNIGNLGCAYLETNNTKEAGEYYIQALEISRKIKNNIDECRWLGNLAVTEQILGNKEKAVNMMEKAYRIAIKTNNHLHVGRWRGKLANMKRGLSMLSIEDTIHELEGALQTTRREDVLDRRFESYWLHDLSFYYSKLKNFERAMDYLKEAVILVGLMGDLKTKAEYLIELYNVQSKFHQPLDVIESIEEAFNLKLRYGRQEEAYKLGKHLANFYLSHGITGKALEKYKQILEFSIEVGNHSEELFYWWQIGLTHYLNHEFEEAIIAYSRHIDRAKELGLPVKEYNYNIFNLGDTYLQLLDYDKAVEYLNLALEHGDAFIHFMANFELALISLKMNRHEEGEQRFRQCFEAYIKLDESEDVTNQIRSILSVILILRRKEKEALKKLQEMFSDSDLTVYELKMALHDTGITKKVLPHQKGLDVLEEQINDKLKSMSKETKA